MVSNSCLITLFSTLTLSVILAEEAIVASNQASLNQNLENDYVTNNVLEGDNFSEKLAEKRRSGFMPMRGRKSYYDEKRSAFMPMRGKKDDDSSEIEQVKRSGFVPMRGRKNDYELAAEGNMYIPSEDEYVKRVSGFLPMRGKKEFDHIEQIKRAAAFHALRGKKADFDFLHNVFGNANSYPQQASANSWWDSFGDKRANAFFGMRGKRSLVD
ncbi:tachykinins-like protein, partial [Dinothrombium tinctorium]